MHGLAEESHIAIVDVPAIFAQMHRDAIRTTEFGLDGGPDGVRLVAPPCLAQGGDVVYVDA